MNTLDRNQEIQLLEQLCNADTYFSEFFKKDLEQMKRNIINDHPIEFDTKFNELPNTLRQENAKVRKHWQEKMSDVMGTVLRSAQEFGDVKLLELAIAEIGHKKVILKKMELDLPLWKLDKSFLMNELQEK